MDKSTINEVIDLMERMEELPGGYTGLLKEERSKKLWPLEIWNGYVVLRHNSSAIIKNGIISSSLGKKNHYTPGSDSGNYFWGSGIIGKDNSNIHDIEYICLVPQETVYDFMKNDKGYQTDSEALANEKYIAYNWDATKGAVVVKSWAKTPISYIEYRPRCNSFEKYPMGLYDGNWNLLRSYYCPGNKRILKNMIKKLKMTKDVELPDFLVSEHDYDYDKLLDFYEKNKKTLTSYWV